MASPTKAFRFTAEELGVLKRLSERMECTETDVVRWGMAALWGLLDSGLDHWTSREYFKDGRRMIRLEDARGRSLSLAERTDGTFYVGSLMGPAYWDADGPPEEPEDG